MRTLITTLLFFVYYANLLGQTPLSYHTEKYKDVLEFPIFSHSEDTIVCKRINTWLQLTMLGLLKGNEKRSLFEQKYDITTSKAILPFALDFTVVNNNAKLLSIYFDIAHNGVTWYYSRIYYNFDRKTGHYIHLEELIEPAHNKTFYEIITAQRLKQLATTVENISKQDLSMEEKENIIEHATTYYEENPSSFEFCIQDSILNIDDFNNFHKN